MITVGLCVLCYPGVTWIFLFFLPRPWDLRFVQTFLLWCWERPSLAGVQVTCFLDGISLCVTIPLFLVRFYSSCFSSHYLLFISLCVSPIALSIPMGTNLVCNTEVCWLQLLETTSCLQWINRRFLLFCMLLVCLFFFLILISL